MRGFRQLGILVIVLLIVASLLISGCSKSCGKEKVTERRERTETIEITSQEPYTVKETRVVGEECVERHYSKMNDSRFNISVDDAEWLGQPPVEGETNYLRRTAYVYNARDVVDTVYLDKIYLYDGEETKRSKTPMKFLVDPKSTRTFYVMWNTQYDPLKDVTVDFTNKSEELGFQVDIMRMCYNKTETVDVTKYREVVTGTREDVVGYDDVVRVKIKRDC